MSADELIYKVKLEQDFKSFRDVEKALEDIERKARGTGGGGGGGRRGGGRRGGDTEQELTALQELNKQLKENREDLAELNKAKREGVALSNEFATAQADTIANIRTLSSQIQEANRGYADQETAINSTATTYNQLTAQNRALSIAMRDLPLDDTTGELERLQEKYSQNNTQLKEFDASMGNFQRNVGNYTGGLRTFASSLAIIQGPLGPLAGRINAIATTIDKVRATMGGATESTSMLSKVLAGNIPLMTASATATKAKATSTVVANTAIKGLNVTLKGLRVALLATGIPAIVIALIGIIQAFKRTEEGAEKLRVIMAGFGSVMEVLLDRFSALGRSIITAFENPGQAVKDLWELIKQNLVNRVTALPKIFSEAVGALSKSLQAAAMAVKGIWSEDAREASRTLFAEAKQDAIDFTEAVGQLLTGIEDPFSKLAKNASEIKEQIDAQSSARRQLQRDMNAVLRRERELSVERAIQNRDLQKAREIARQLDEDAQVRLEELRKAGELENRQSEKEIANERERLRIMEAQRDLSDTDSKTKDEIAAQQVKLADLERASSEKRMKLLRDINTVERQIREENLRRERTSFELNQRNIDLNLQKTRDALTEEGRITQALRNDLTRLETEAEADKARIREVFLVEFLNQKFSQEEAERLATEKADIESQEAIYKARKALRDQERKERTDADKFDRDIALQREQMLLSFERDRLIRQGRFVEAASLEELDQRSLYAKIFNDEFQNLREQGYTEEEAMRRANETAEIQSEQRIYDAKRALMDAELQQRLNNANLAANAIGAINSAFFNESKELAVAKAIIDTYAGANSAFAETKGGIEAKIIAAGIAIASGFANVKKILSTKIGDKSVSRTSASAPRVASSFGLVDVGTNRQSFAFDTATMAQSATSGQMAPKIVLAGEFDPSFLAVKVTMGNNQISSQGTGF